MLNNKPRLLDLKKDSHFMKIHIHHLLQENYLKGRFRMKKNQMKWESGEHLKDIEDLLV
jgi:hypothetical protein